MKDLLPPGCSEHSETFSQVLHEILEDASIREDKRITLQDLTSRLNYSKAHIARFINGELLPTPKIFGMLINTIEARLGCSKEQRARLSRAYACDAMKELLRKSGLDRLTL